MLIYWCQQNNLVVRKVVNNAGIVRKILRITEKDNFINRRSGKLRIDRKKEIGSLKYRVK